MTAEEAFHAFLSGLAPHLQEHVGAHVQGDLEAVMAMAQHLEVHRGAGDGAKAGGEKKRSGRFPKKQTKRGQHLQWRGMKPKKLSKSFKISQRNRARARDVNSSSNKRRKSNSEGSVSTVEAITS